MRKTLLKKSMTAILLLVLTFNATATITLLVQADAGGTGKYLAIKIIGEGYVNATKVKSGETWLFYQNDTQKVGAGTVELTAIADDGWVFSHWEGDVSEPLNSPTDYKTEKYGVVTVVFVGNFAINASAVGDGIIDPEGVVIVVSGDNQTFEFAPDPGNHISAIVVDGVYQSSFATNYTFYNVNANHTIEVIFDLEGQATVPEVLAGGTTDVFLASTARLTIGPTEGGTAYGGEEIYALGAGAWEISITLIIDGLNATLTYNSTGLSLEDELNLFLVKAETIETLRSDVNGDLEVDGDDVSDVANAVKHLQWYDAIWDINNDGFVNEDDVHVVNENKGATLTIVPNIEIDTDADTITFSLEEFSVFGAR